MHEVIRSGPMLHRRELLLVGAGAIAAKATGSVLACASDGPAPSKADDTKPATKTAAKTAAKKDDPAMDETEDPHAGHKGHGGPDAAATELAAFGNDCVTAGNACLSHCLRLLADGDKSMGDCAKRVNDMLAVCEATARLAANGSDHVKAIAAVCHAACSDCAKACTPHAGHHAECKACKEACEQMMTVTKTLAG